MYSTLDEMANDEAWDPAESQAFNVEFASPLLIYSYIN